MSKYVELRNNSPKLTIKEGAKEVIFKTSVLVALQFGLLGRKDANN